MFVAAAAQRVVMMRFHVNVEICLFVLRPSNAQSGQVPWRLCPKGSMREDKSDDGRTVRPVQGCCALANQHMRLVLL